MDKVLTTDQLLSKYRMFMILEGQLGLPDQIQEIKSVIDKSQAHCIVLEELFDYPSMVMAIPHINPDVIIFQTTLMNKDEIDKIVTYLESVNFKPKEIWQIIRGDIPIADAEKYNIYSPYVEDGKIHLVKL